MSESQNHVSDTETVDPEVDDEGPCKWGPFKPTWCQRFRNPKWVLFWLCCIATIQGMVLNGFVNVVITTIEKRFGISSTESGTIASCYDIASAICLLPVTYFGGFGIRPRYIGIGVVVLAVGSFLFALPHFTTGIYNVDITQDSLCNIGGNTTSTCDSSVDGSLANYRFVFIVAMLLIGAGASPFYTLGVTYLDDALPQRSVSLYVGIFYAFVVFGTAIGYLAGGEFLNIWTDIGAVDRSSVTISTDNRRWVGAWWLGFIIAGVLALLVAIPISGFPSFLPAMLLAGFSTFTPKYLEFQFGQPAARAAQYVGFAAIPAGVGGTLVGGYLVKRFNPRVSTMLKCSIVASVLVVIFMLIFLIECENVPFAGINSQYQNGSTSGTVEYLGKQLDNQCNANCGCTEQDYRPVCGRDGILYFSPCYAGCDGLYQGSTTRYSNCSCIISDVADYMAEFTSCESPCVLLPAFLCMFAVSMFLILLVSMPSLAVTLRFHPWSDYLWEDDRLDLSLVATAL